MSKNDWQTTGSHWGAALIFVTILFTVLAIFSAEASIAAEVDLIGDILKQR